MQVLGVWTIVRVSIHLCRPFQQLAAKNDEQGLVENPGTTGQGVIVGPRSRVPVLSDKGTQALQQIASSLDEQGLDENPWHHGSGAD